MKCFDWRRVQTFVDGRAETREYGQMMTHLSECKTCQVKVGEEKRLSHFVKWAALVYGETQSLEKTILTKIEELRRKPQWIPTPEPVSILSWIQPWAVQAAALWTVAILLGSWLGVIIGTTSQRQATPLIDTWTGSFVQILSQRAERGTS